MNYIKFIGVTFEQFLVFFKKVPFFYSFRIIVIPSVLLSFLPYYCHSFQIIVTPSVLLSFLPNYRHSFRKIAILNICHLEYLSPKVERVRKLAGRASHICQYTIKHRMSYVHTVNDGAAGNLPRPAL